MLYSFWHILTGHLPFLPLQTVWFIQSVNLKELMHEFIWTISPVSHKWLNLQLSYFPKLKNKKASCWFCGTGPFLESSSVSIMELQKDDHRSLDPPQSITICWEYFISTAHFYKACRSEPISQMIDLPKKNQEMGVILLFPINRAWLQFILSIRGELMVFGWAHWNMSDSFHKD